MNTVTLISCNCQHSSCRLHHESIQRAGSASWITSGATELHHSFLPLHWSKCGVWDFFHSSRMRGKVFVQPESEKPDILWLARASDVGQTDDFSGNFVFTTTRHSNFKKWMNIKAWLFLSLNSVRRYFIFNKRGYLWFLCFRKVDRIFNPLNFLRTKFFANKEGHACSLHWHWYVHPRSIEILATVFLTRDQNKTVATYTLSLLCCHFYYHFVKWVSCGAKLWCKRNIRPHPQFCRLHSENSGLIRDFDNCFICYLLGRITSPLFWKTL